MISQVYDFLATQTAQNNVLCTNTGAPLTIGDIHTKIERWSAELGLTNPHGFYFCHWSRCRTADARGNPQDLLELGKTIVFDYFPQEIGGGRILWILPALGVWVMPHQRLTPPTNRFIKLSNWQSQHWRPGKHACSPIGSARLF